MLRSTGLTVYLGLSVMLICAVSCISSNRNLLQTRVYLVEESFWLSAVPKKGMLSDTQLSRDFQKFFEYAGVEFSDGAYIKVKQGRNKIILHNTPKQLDRLEELMAPMRGGGTFYKERIK